MFSHFSLQSSGLPRDYRLKRALLKKRRGKRGNFLFFWRDNAAGLSEDEHYTILPVIWGSGVTLFESEHPILRKRLRLKIEEDLSLKQKFDALVKSPIFAVFSDLTC